MTSTSAGGEQQDYIGKNSMDSYEVKKVNGTGKLGDGRTGFKEYH